MEGGFDRENPALLISRSTWSQSKVNSSFSGNSRGSFTTDNKDSTVDGSNVKNVKVGDGPKICG